MKVFLLGILALIGAWAVGRYKSSSSAKEKHQAELKAQEKKTEKAEAERDLAIGAAQTVVQKTANDVAIEEYFDEFETEVKTAKQENNILAAIESAKKLAERAEGWRQRNNP